MSMYVYMYMQTYVYVDIHVHCAHMSGCEDIHVLSSLPNSVDVQIFGKYLMKFEA